MCDNKFGYDYFLSVSCLFSTLGSLVLSLIHYCHFPPVQVNAGVGEVAKVFLNPSRGFANPATALNKNNANNASTLSFSTPLGSVKDTPAGVQCPTPLAPAGVLANSNNATNATNATTAGARSSPLNETGGDSPSGQSTVVTALVDLAQTQHEQDLVLKLKVCVVLIVCVIDLVRAVIPLLLYWMPIFLAISFS